MERCSRGWEMLKAEGGELWDDTIKMHQRHVLNFQFFSICKLKVRELKYLPYNLKCKNVSTTINSWNIFSP